MVKKIHFDEKERYDILKDYIDENGEFIALAGGDGGASIFHYKASTVVLVTDLNSEHMFSLVVGSDEDSQEKEVMNELEKILGK